VLLEIGIHGLVSVGEVLDVSPGPVDFGAADLATDVLILREIVIVDVSVIAEEECTEIQCQIRILRIRRQDIG